MKKIKKIATKSTKEKKLISLKSFAEKLFNEKSVALVCHVRPDGDTIGSTCALKCALESAGIKTEVFCADEIPSRFFFLEKVKEIKNKLTEDEFSAFVAVDCADITRLGTFASKFSKCKNTYSIDHHVSNDHFAKTNYVCDSASNCENIYQLLQVANVKIDKEIANFLAMGIMTDTGGFRHKNVTATTLSIAASLAGKGADLNKISYYMFTMQSKERALLFSKAMSSIRYFHGDKVAIAVVEYKDFLSTKAKQDETEGFIDFLMGISTVEIGICLSETEKNKFKVSFRSKGADVNAVASRFGGGGHIHASGCKINGDKEEIIDKLQFVAGQYIEE